MKIKRIYIYFAIPLVLYGIMCCIDIHNNKHAIENYNKYSQKLEQERSKRNHVVQYGARVYDYCEVQ